MNITKFLLIDFALIIASIPIFLVLKRKKASLFKSTYSEQQSQETLLKIPNIEKLLELEKIASVKGSGIEFDSLIGSWKFITIWKQDANEEDSLFSSLLRFFSAKIVLKKNLLKKNLVDFSINTSIQFGPISIEFSGNAYLKGDQPFLYFFFNLIELKSGSINLFSKSLDQLVKKEKLFFALIASGTSNEWLSARGQGGALVLWLKE